MFLWTSNAIHLHSTWITFPRNRLKKFKWVENPFIYLSVYEKLLTLPEFNGKNFFLRNYILFLVFLMLFVYWKLTNRGSLKVFFYLKRKVRHYFRTITLIIIIIASESAYLIVFVNAKLFKKFIILWKTPKISKSKARNDYTGKKW